MSMKSFGKAIALGAVLVAGQGAADAARMVATPVLPVYGQSVSVEVHDLPGPVYLPATRYIRSGFNILLEYEVGGNSHFGPIRPDFGRAPPLVLGELPPGNYTLQARIFRIDAPHTQPEVITQTLAVVPPSSWGLYTVPRQPEAFAQTDVLLRSAAYFEPGSMQVSVSGSVIRLDFSYRGDAPAGGATPSGMATYGSARLPALAPGHYTLEGWGREKTSGKVERYFTHAFTVDSAASIIEYYSAASDHYFVAGAADETSLLDAGGMGDWKRTTQRFKAWLRMGDGPPAAKGVCRFYARGPNSHFYTGSASECDFLKSLEARDRAQAQARGQPFLGWGYEGIAFYALLPENGQCPGGTRPVHRAYNARAAQNDSNHRFMLDEQQRAAMLTSWADEGVAFCSPP